MAYVGLGANLDEPARQVERALHELGGIAQTRLVKASSLYRSAPLGYAGQPPFVNAVAQLETDLSAGELLDELQAIEARHGRRRCWPDARGKACKGSPECSCPPPPPARCCSRRRTSS